jgi:hypothetical protein
MLQLVLMKFRLNSIKSRVTVFTLAIFLIGMVALSAYVSAMLQDDLTHSLGEQQLAEATLVAADIERDLGNRINSLQRLADSVTPAMMRDAALLQAHLQERHALLLSFNAGLVAYQPDGTAMAEVPVQTGRVGVNYAERAHFIGAIKGQPTVGEPHVFLKKGIPVFLINVPIRAPDGHVIGALAGVINLSTPNFLDTFMAQSYGNSGSYVLVDAARRRVITATDKTRILASLPVPGSNQPLDQLLAGHEDFAVMHNPSGEQALVAVKAIPLANWILTVAVPTNEAFAPIVSLQQRLLLATVVFTLLAGLLIWWQLRRELYPMFTAVKSLAALAESDQSPAPLSLTRTDEIGKLIAGFNRLLTRLLTTN